LVLFVPPISLCQTGPTPHIDSISPTTGVAGTEVTISGSGFGATKGSGDVWLGSKPGVVVSWSDTQVVATVASGSVTGTAKVLQGGVWSNKEPFTVVGQTSLRIVPGTMNMLVGETQTLQVFDGDTGSIVTNVTWSISDPTVAEISTDNPPVLTTKAAGHATITAGDATGDLTVHQGSVLPEGTVRWSVDPTPNFEASQIVQATPVSENTPDLYTVESGSGEIIVRGFTVDGQQKTFSRLTTPTDPRTVVPDQFGGLLMLFESTDSSGNVQNSLVDLDGTTGAQRWNYDSPALGYLASDLAVGQDGTVFAVETDSHFSYSYHEEGEEEFWVTSWGSSSLLALDGATGAVKSRTALP
jgi:hypothetical protein